jgi:hypothetical protein
MLQVDASHAQLLTGGSDHDYNRKSAGMSPTEGLISGWPTDQPEIHPVNRREVLHHSVSISTSHPPLAQVEKIESGFPEFL